MPADLNATFGALLISVVLSAALFGVVGVQTFHYFQNYGSDNILVKLVVSILLVLELLHSICNTHAIYYYTVVNYANPTALYDSTWSLTMTIAISNAVVSIVHMFYIRRVYYVSHKNVVLVIPIVILALGRFVMITIVTIKGFQLKHFKALELLTPYMDSSLSLVVATDTTIAASLLVYLHKSRSGMRNTDTMINRLMVYTINNGISTSVFDIIILVFVTSRTQNFIFVALYQVLGNLYTNAMLAMLNSRRSMTQVGEVTGISFRLPISTTSTGNPVAARKPSDSTRNIDNITGQTSSQCA